jgi:hypothetical protein
VSGQSGSRSSGSLAKFLMITLDRTGLEDPVLGTEIDRILPSTAVNRRCRYNNHPARTTK